MLEDFDRDKWGQGYRMVVKKTHLTRNNKMGDVQQWAMARSLFPEVADDVEAGGWGIQDRGSSCLH